ncbi:MAG TPA: hypothetical protein VJS91_04720 [Nitrososphaeraceae archaeon]|nr:hypothetical protein [Nitrososphaeraceae archaeon]
MSLRSDSNTRMFILLIVSIASLFIEIVAARLYNILYSGIETLVLSEIFFVSGIIIFSTSHTFILMNIRKRMKDLPGIKRHTLKYMMQYMIIVQIVLNVLMMIILFQILNNLSYKTYLVITMVSISYLSGIINISLLTEKFTRWILNKRTYVSLSFCIAIGSVLVSMLSSFIFILRTLSLQPKGITWHAGILSVPISDFTLTLSQIYSVFFIISYVASWLATITVLHNYSFKIGKAKFWAFVILPLLYFIGEFEPLYFPLLSEYRRMDPVGFTVTYVLIFSSIRFGGALFFGIGFWVMSRNIEKKLLKTFLNISAYGLILLFVTNQASLLLNNLFPPLGLITASFVGLSSFLLLVGTYSAALYVSNDMNLRRTIRTSVEKQARLIGYIGTAEFQDKLSSKVSAMLNNLPTSLQDKQMELSFTDDDIRTYTNEVIEELSRRKKLK